MAITKIEVPELFDFGSDNSAFKLPTGTTAERPTSPSNGEMRFNTTTGYVEYYDTTDAQWWEIDYAPILPSDNFNTVLYQGNGSTQAVTGTAFTPDLVWVKGRSVATSNNLFDSIRGNQRIISNSTGAQVDLNPYAPDGLPSFNSNGFNIGDNFNGDYGLNGDPSGTYGSAAGYVAWCWKAGGAAVTIAANTVGNTIASDVSANVNAGFSIVKYTGNSTIPSTVAHGLDSAPELIMVKVLNQSYPWNVFSASIGNTKYLKLNETSAEATQISRWNNTSPTSAVFTIGNDGDVNGNGLNYIAYAFHSVAGYSKMGSYVGNGSATGPIITLGFEPAFVMVKNTTGTGLWLMSDNKRQTAATKTTYLQAQSSDAEYSPYTWIEYLSNGFQLKNTGSSLNTNGSTYIFMAFAVDPT